MIGSEIALNPESLEEAVEWERAAQLLDIPPEVLSRLRIPQLEFVSRPPATPQPRAELVPLFGCNCGPNSISRIASLAVGPHSSDRTASADAQHVQLCAALAGLNESASGLALRVRPEDFTERELWSLAKELCPEVNRHLGTVRLIAKDLPSAAFASWMVYGGTCYPMEFPRVAAMEYVARREEQLGWSLTAACSNALRSFGINLRGARLLIVGTKSLSRTSADILVMQGAEILGVADESGGLLLPRGEGITDVWRHVQGGGLLAEFAGGEHVHHADVLALDADLAIIASGRAEVTEANASTVRARVVAELIAPGLSRGAVEILDVRGLTVLPEPLLESACLLTLSWKPGSESQGAAAVQSFVNTVWEEIQTFGQRFKTPPHRSMLLLALQRLASWAALARP